MHINSVKFAVSMKPIYISMRHYILLLGTFLFISKSVISQDTTSKLQAFNKVDVASNLIQVKKAGLAGIYPFDPQYVSIKRVNPSPAKQPPDWEHIALKDSISQAIASRNSRRSNFLTDSLKVEFGYESNPFSGLTPMDNHIAISNDGIIVSVINTNIVISDTLGTTLLYRVMNKTFFGDNTLTGTIYDPRVLYDPDNDRFILVVLHGSTSATSKVLVCFSKSNRPDVDGWHYYTFNGNPFGNGLWFDYPNIGTNKNELFITGNLFTDSRSYANQVIFQIDKMGGYAGTNNISSRTWGGITLGGGRLQNSDGDLPFTMVPAYYGFAGDNASDMWFVSTNSGSGNKIYVYRITEGLNNNPSMEISAAQIPYYTQENLSSQFSGGVGASPVRLISGDSRMKNAYIQHGVIHCVWNARPAGYSFSTIIYARIDAKTKEVKTKSFSENGTDYAFSAIAPFSTQNDVLTTLIVYTSSSAVKYPDIGVLTCDNEMNFSTPVTVKEGESFVSIYPQNNQTRWGDYSGIAKKYNASRPEVWVMGSYGFFTSGSAIPRHWKNWNGKIVSRDNIEQNVGTQRLYPNPVDDPSQTVTFNFIAAKSGEYKVKIFDMNGKLVSDLFSDILFPGEYRMTFSTSGFAIGSYIVRYFMDGKQLGFEKLLVISK